MTGYRSVSRLAVIAAGAVAALSLAACSSPSATPSATTTAGASAAATTAAISAVPKCDSSTAATSLLKLGAFFPLTGGLAYLGPASVGGADLALNDINAAGGVNGTKACINLGDSSDTPHASISIANIKKMLQSKVSAVVGPESSGVTYNILPTIKASQTVLFSNAATDDGLSGVSPYFFRNPAPNTFEAKALGNQIIADGRTKVGVLVFNDPYATNLRDGIQSVVEAGGGSITYGAKGKNQEFPATQTNFGSDVSALLATKPDAVVIDTFDQIKQIIPALAAAKFDLSKVYLIDGDLGDYTGIFPTNALNGAKGTTQGVNPAPDLKTRIAAAYMANGGSSKITSYAYGAEAYDAVTMMALAAEKAKSTDSASIQKNLPLISGTTGGTICKSFAACSALLKAGKEIQYSGYAGTGPFNAKHDVSSGYISMYQYVGNNPSKFLGSSKESD